MFNFYLFACCRNLSRINFSLRHFVLWFIFQLCYFFLYEYICLFSALRFAINRFVKIYRLINLCWKTITSTLTSIFIFSVSSSFTLSQKSIFIVFVIFVFLQTKHRYIHDVSNEIIHIVNSIIVTNRRSTRLSINRKRIIKTFEFVESIHFSIDWILKSDFFVSVVRNFHVVIEQYRQIRIYQNFLLIARNFSFIDITSNRSTMQKRFVISKTSKTTEKFFASRSKRFRHEHVVFLQNKNNFKTFNYFSFIEKSNFIDTIIIDSNQSTNNDSNSIDNTRRINEINIEKIIHHQLIDLNLYSINNHNMNDKLNSIVQTAIDIVVDNVIKQIIARFQQRQQSFSNDETNDDDYVEKTKTNENTNRSIIQFL